MTVAIELWARGLGMVIAGYWFALVALLGAGAFLFVKRKRAFGVACWVAALVVAPYVQVFIWNGQTNATRAWLGDWAGSFGTSNVQIEFQSNNATTIFGSLTASGCHSGGNVVAVVDARKMTIVTTDAKLSASLSGDSASLSGTVTGCGNEGGTVQAKLVKSRNP